MRAEEVSIHPVRKIQEAAAQRLRKKQPLRRLQPWGFRHRLTRHSHRSSEAIAMREGTAGSLTKKILAVFQCFIAMRKPT